MISSQFLRDGRKVDEGPVGEFSIDRIISDMVGKELKNKYPKKMFQSEM